MKNILSNFESALHIKYVEQDLKDTVQNAVIRVINTLGITKEELIARRNLVELVHEKGQLMYSNALMNIRENVADAAAKLCFKTVEGTYLKSFEISLPAVSYLGVAPEQLVSVLNSLSRKDFAEETRKRIPELLVRANAPTLPAEIKRLITVMAVLSELSFDVEAAMISYYLFCGCVI